jgi:hypothetical protein
MSDQIEINGCCIFIKKEEIRKLILEKKLIIKEKYNG